MFKSTISITFADLQFTRIIGRIVDFISFHDVALACFYIRAYFILQIKMERRI